MKRLIALVAVISAVTVSAGLAQVATGANLYSERGIAVTITGAQEGTAVLKVLGGELKCTTVKFEDKQVNPPTTSISLIPSYSGCTFAGLASTVSVNGCEFSLDTASGTTNITCLSGKEITVTAPSVGAAKCVLHIPPQSGIGSISYSKTGSGTTREVLVEQNLSGIKYDQTKGSAETGNCETKDGVTTGTFIGKTRLTAEEYGKSNHVGLYTADEPEVEVELYSEKGLPATVTGTQEGTDALKVLGGELKCTTVKFEDEHIDPPTRTIDLAPSYSGCTFAGLSSAVSVNGCEFALDTISKTTDIVCPSGKEITVTAPNVGTAKCVLHIPPQSGIGGVSYSTSGVGTTREVVVAQSLSGIKYSQTKGSAETGNCETKDAVTTGAFTGEARLTAEEYAGSGHIGVYTAEEPEVEVELHSEKGLPVTITGVQEGISVLNTSWGTLSCESANFNGTVKTLPTAEFRLLPSYSKCSFGIFYGASITTNGCEFVFKTASYRTDIDCPAGKEITIVAPSVGTPKCIFHIPEQSGIGVLTYSNAGTGTTEEVVVEQDSSKIRYAQTKGTAEANLCSTEDETTGTFTGSMRLTGEQDNEAGAHAAIYVE